MGNSDNPNNPSQATSPSSSSRLTWRHVDLAILASYLILTILYGQLGYLDRPGARIRGGDSDHHFVYLPALLFGGDLDLSEELDELVKHTFRFASADSRPGNPYSIGPAVLWAPFYLFGHFASLLSDGYPTDGMSPPYQASVYIGNGLLTALGLLLTVRFLRILECSREGSLLAVISVIFASQLSYYLWPLSATSHGTSFTTVSLFAWSAVRYGIGWKSGLCGGLAALVRWQNVLIVAPITIALHIAERGRRLDVTDARKWVPFLGAAFLSLSPQLMVWWSLYGSPFVVPQGPGFVDFTDLPLLRILLSPRHGLFLWHPILVAGAVGLAIRYRSHRHWIAGIGVAFVLQWIMNAAILDWWGTWSFGHRRFVNLLPFFALGIALLHDHSKPRVRTGLVAAVLVLSLWNQLFLYQYQNGLIPRSESPTFAEMVTDKLTLPRVHKAQLHVNTAIAAFRQDDFANYLDQSAKAYRAYPEYRNSRLVYSVAGSALQDHTTAEQLFSEWHEGDPTSLVATWGLANAFVRAGRQDEAERLFEPNLWGQAASDAINQIRAGNQTLMDRTFFDFYRAELDSVYIH